MDATRILITGIPAVSGTVFVLDVYGSCGVRFPAEAPLMFVLLKGTRKRQGLWFAAALRRLVLSHFIRS